MPQEGGSGEIERIQAFKLLFGEEIFHNSTEEEEQLRGLKRKAEELLDKRARDFENVLSASQQYVEKAKGRYGDAVSDIEIYGTVEMNNQVLEFVTLRAEKDGQDIEVTYPVVTFNWEGENDSSGKHVGVISPQGAIFEVKFELVEPSYSQYKQDRIYEVVNVKNSSLPFSENEVAARARLIPRIDDDSIRAREKIQTSGFTLNLWSQQVHKNILIKGKRMDNPQARLMLGAVEVVDNPITHMGNINVADISRQTDQVENIAGNLRRGIQIASVV